MNLQTHIRSNLWLAISSTYEAKNYCHAILDAMHHLSNILREKAGVDGDGVSLVGQALGGNSPKLRVNKLQTETERNIQKGLEQILRGLYQGIRNPRSHEQYEDSQSSADAIIYFIDYLLGVLEESEEPFTIPKFLSMVFDAGFVESDRYGQLLASEVPEKKRLDALIKIYRNRKQGDGKKLIYIVNAILQRFSQEEMTDFLSVVSEDLRTIQDIDDLIISLQIIPPHLWLQLDETARLRIENKLIMSIRQGKMNPKYPDIPTRGELGTLAISFLDSFTMKSEVAEVFIQLLTNRNNYVRHYVAFFFMEKFPAVFISKSDRRNCIKTISRLVRAEDEFIKRTLVDVLWNYPDIWKKEILEEFRDITDEENAEFYLPDGTPFLTKPPEDEIPF